MTSRLSLKTRYGLLDVPFSETDLICRFLARYGEWAWDEVCFASSLVRPGARILDGGAFLGTFGLGLMRRKRANHVCFVEASADVVPLLNENLVRNALCEFSVVEGILAGDKAVNANGRSEPGNAGGTSFSLTAKGDISVPGAQRVVKLADLVRERGPFDLIKLDIEGMEREVLLADNFWTLGEASFIVECNETLEAFDLGCSLIDSGLPIYYFAFPAFNPSNFRGSKKPIFFFAYEACIVVAPRQQPELSRRLVKNKCILNPIRSAEELRMAMWQTPRWGMPTWGDIAPEIAASRGREALSHTLSNFLTR